MHYVNTSGAMVSWAESLRVISENWKPGEILILVSTLLAPLPYLLAKYHRARRHFTGYLFLLFVLLVTFVASSLIFAHDRLGAVRNEEFVRNFSIGLYIVALLVSYWGLVFQRKLDNTPKDNSSDRADNIAAQLQQGGS